jgi:hypothetical protein
MNYTGRCTDGGGVRGGAHRSNLASESRIPAPTMAGLGEGEGEREEREGREGGEEGGRSDRGQAAQPHGRSGLPRSVTSPCSSRCIVCPRATIGRRGRQTAGAITRSPRAAGRRARASARAAGRHRQARARRTACSIS